MKVILLFIFSIILYAVTYSMPFVYLFNNGRYEASLNVFGDERESWAYKYEIENKNDDFNAYVYISGSGIFDSAVFKLDGKYTGGNRNGTYNVQYKVKNIVPTKIIDIGKLSPYSDLLKKTDKVNHENIKLIYRSKNIKIIKTGVMGNTLIYKIVD